MEVVPVSIVIPWKESSAEKVSLWMQTRKENGHLDGMLEFPGGKIRKDETPDEAGIRETLEETGVKIDGSLLSLRIIPFQYKDRTVLLYVHAIEDSTGCFSQEGWFDFNRSSWKVDFKNRIPEANFEVVSSLMEYLA